MRTIKTVVFDLGGVLIDWNPRHLYRKIFNDEDKMEWFLTEVCNSEWNLLQDGGRPFKEAVAELSGEYPELKDEIAAYFERWEEMLGGEIAGTVGILEMLKSNGTPLYALTNWSGETFPIAYSCCSCLKKFDGIVVSGYEKKLKPDYDIYKLLVERYDIIPEESVFIDDNLVNTIAAQELGFAAIHFSSPEQLKQELINLAILPDQN